MSKQLESKLDRYAETLAAMEAEKKTLAEMQAWLKAEGCVVALSTLSRFLESSRQRRLQEKLLDQISSGADQCAEVEKSFKANPAPALETLIKLQRVLILNLSAQANVNPEMMKWVATSFSSVLDSERLRIKNAELDLNTRKVALLEKKAQAFDQAKQVIESKLSPEEQKNRLKEILK